jgi:hypothetical protein
MNLNDILLNHDQLEQLYRDKLVTTDLSQQEASASAPSAANAATTALPLLKGKYKKKFLWLVYEQQHPFLDEADFEFLSQVLEACRLNLDDIYLCNCFQSNLLPLELMQQLSPVTVIASGLPPAEWNASIPLYQPVQQKESTLCCTEALSMIRADKTIKSKLWFSLKQILGL